MASHQIAAALFALFAVPAFVFARWLSDGRLPLPRGSAGMTVGTKAVLDSKLARLMRMTGIAMLATGVGMLLWGDDARRLLGLIVVMALLVNGLALASVLVIVSAKRRARGQR